jgi:molybdenum cofactor synthesis domain-containing protein
VKVEDTETTDGVVTVKIALKRGTNVRPRGEDIAPGATILRAGTIVGPADVGVLASVGRATIAVRRRPSVAIVSTGAELVEIDQTPGPAQVVNSNAWVLAAAVAQAGGAPVVLPIARDRLDDIRARVEEAAAADVVLSTGGVSVGEFDFVRDALDAIGVQRKFWKVAQKPGKPLTFGTLGRRLFFGLPGNPVSALVCFAVYVRPALRKLAGHAAIHHPIVQARLATGVRKATNLTEFVRVHLKRAGDGGPRCRSRRRARACSRRSRPARGFSSVRRRRRRSPRATSTPCWCWMPPRSTGAPSCSRAEARELSRSSGKLVGPNRWPSPPRPPPIGRSTRERSTSRDSASRSRRTSSAG